MAAHREPIEIDPETPIGEAMERVTRSSGETELRIGSHLYVVHRRVEKPAEEDPKGNAHLVLAAAKEFRDSLNDDVDWEQVRKNIDELRDYERENPRPLPKFE